MIQLSLPLPRDWHEARADEAEKRCKEAVEASVRGHKRRPVELIERVKFYRTAQLRHETRSKAVRQRAAA